MIHVALSYRVVSRFMTDAPEPMNQRMSVNVPPELEVIIYALLKFDARERIASARELADKLHETEHATLPEPAAILDDIALEIIERV